MSYEILTPTSTDFNVNREFAIVKSGFAKLGVKVTQKVGGDTTATYALETGDCSGAASKQYTGFDIAMWDWVGYVDPDFMLSVVTRGQWCSWSDTGVNNPAYDKLYAQQGKTVDPSHAEGSSSTRCRRSSTTTSSTRSSSTSRRSTRTRRRGRASDPELNGYSKLYYTSPGRRRNRGRRRRGAGAEARS